MGNSATEAASRDAQPHVVQRATVLLVSGLVLFSILSVLALRQYNLETAFTKQVDQAVLARTTVERFGQEIYGMESEQRGFLLTEDISYLSDFRSGRERMDRTGRDLLDQTRNNAALRTRVRALLGTLDAKVSELEETVELASSGQRDAALQIVRTDKGRFLMEGLLDDVAAFRQSELEAEAGARNALRRTRRNLSILSAAALASGLLLIFVILVLLRRNAAAISRGLRQTERAEIARGAAEHEQERVETLLEEMNHRIGNSLGMVSALLGLQRSRSDDTNVREALAAARTRIHAVATAHRRLRLAPDMETTDLAPVLTDMAGDLRATQPRQDIELVTDFVNADVSDRDAVTLGLLMSELIVNAFKHAFVGREGGTVTAETYFNEDADFVLRVKDDGIGFPEGKAQAADGLGSSIVARMSRQFGGELDYSPLNDGGTCIALIMPKLAVAAKP